MFSNQAETDVGSLLALLLKAEDMLDNEIS
jgi:hypothetical protein